MYDPYFQIISKKIPINPTKKIDFMKVVLEATDIGCTKKTNEVSVLYITDVMLQGGTVATSWVGHVSEIRWAFDTA